MIDDHELARLIRLLAPAPRNWVEAAADLPFISDDLADVLERASRDEAYLASLRSDPSVALREKGIDPSPAVVAHLMRSLPDPS